MKKILLPFLATVISLCAVHPTNAQNIQVLYDINRACVTSTVEMFRPDDFGSTYFFVDMDASQR